jgi:hypothetical protein
MYDIIYILIAESYNKKVFFPPIFRPFSLVNRYDIIWNRQIMALYLSYYYL